VPSSRRRLPPEEDDLEPPEDPAALHAAMLGQIEDLEQALDAGQARGIGHNRPPEAIEQTTLSPQDAAEIKAALATLKKQPTEPADQGKDAQTALDRLRQMASRLKDFVTLEIAKEAVKYAAGGLLVWLVPKLEAAIVAAARWLASISFGL